MSSADVHENVQEGNEINLSDFPAPLLHEKDGDRYLGTGHLVITKDPDSEAAKEAWSKTLEFFKKYLQQ